MSIKSIFASISKKEIERPIFILGCGRSGTTIFGSALSRHKDITYLNERRDLWFKAYPETDIWTHRARANHGRMNLVSEDADAEKSRKLRRLFYRENMKTTRPILVEKLPINSFRVEFIHAIFPDARFIHIYRNGLEVARSIRKMCENESWFGVGEYKWKQLKDYSESDDVTSGLPELCDSDYYKGLLEWRLSTESVTRFLSTLPDEKYMEISYATLLREPVETIRRVLDYIGVDDDSSVMEFAKNNISRRTRNMDDDDLSDIESKLGGKLLPLSMVTIQHPTWHCPIRPQ